VLQREWMHNELCYGLSALASTAVGSDTDSTVPAQLLREARFGIQILNCLELRFIAALFINMNFLFVLMVCAVVVTVVEGQSKEEAWRVYKVTQSTFTFWRFNQILIVFQ
jgi:hypothetical protein